MSEMTAKQLFNSLLEVMDEEKVDNKHQIEICFLVLKAWIRADEVEV